MNIKYNGGMQEENLYLLVTPELKDIYENNTEKIIIIDIKNFIL